MASSERENAAEADVVLSPDLVLVVAVGGAVGAAVAAPAVPGRHLHAVPASPPGLASLGADERALVALADGKRSVRELARASGLPDADVMKSMRSLYARGVLVPANGASVVAAPPSAAVAPAPGEETIDYDYAAEEGGAAAAAAGHEPGAGAADARSGGAAGAVKPNAAPIVVGKPPAVRTPADGAVASGTVGTRRPSPVPVAVAGTMIVGGERARPPSPPGGGATSAAPKPGSGAPAPRTATPVPRAATPVPRPSTPAEARPPARRPETPAAPRAEAHPETIVGLPASAVGAPPAPPEDAGDDLPFRPKVTAFWTPQGARQSPFALASANASGQPRKTARGATVIVGSSPAQVRPTTAGGTSGAGVAPGAVPDTEMSSASSSGFVAETATPHGAAGAADGAGGPIAFRVGAYEVATRLAQGAMGSVYICRRVGAAGFQRLFALKVVRQHAVQKEVAVRSFMREARVGALLDHPNVQTVVDVGSYNEQPFLILDYIEGASFSELSQTQRPPAPVVVAVLLDILRGLQQAHDVTDEQGQRLGLVHGDVSSHNILVGVDGAARLTDFGSARFTLDAAEKDQKLAVGKPAYMAPEQLCGEPLDARTDLFAVGVTMWTALTGQKLFGAETYEETVMKVLRKKIDPPSAHGAPACLDEICLRALSRPRDARFASAEEMGRTLLAVAAAEGVVASPRDVGQWVRRELGQSLGERRRRIQAVFGGTGKIAVRPDGGPGGFGGGAGAVPSAAHAAAVAAAIADGGATAADGSPRRAAPTVPAVDTIKRPAPTLHVPKTNTKKTGRSRQWGLVVASAVVACAATLAIAYFLANPFAPRWRSKPLPGATTAAAAATNAPATGPLVVPSTVDPPAPNGAAPAVPAAPAPSPATAAAVDPAVRAAP